MANRKKAEFFHAGRYTENLLPINHNPPQNTSDTSSEAFCNSSSGLNVAKLLANGTFQRMKRSRIPVFLGKAFTQNHAPATANYSTVIRAFTNRFQSMLPVAAS